MKKYKTLSLILAVVYSAVIAAPSALASDVRISEYHANPDIPLVNERDENRPIFNLEAGREWVELQNITPDPVSLSGYSLSYTYQTNSGDRTRTLNFTSDVIPANGYFVVCGVQSATQNCDKSWALELGVDLKNTSGTFKLFKTAAPAEVLDTVTYETTQNGTSSEVALDGTQTPATSEYTASINVPFYGEYEFNNNGTPGTADDTTPPPVPSLITGSDLKHNTTTNKITAVEWNAVEDTDNVSAPVKYVYQVSNSPDVTTEGKSFVTPLNTSGLLAEPRISVDYPDGTYYWHVRALDNRGNTSAWSAVHVFTIESIAPVITIDYQETSSTSPEITGFVDDINAVIELSIDGNTYTLLPEDIDPETGAWSLPRGVITPALTVDTYDIVATATDIYGNIGTDTEVEDLVVFAVVTPAEAMPELSTPMAALTAAPAEAPAPVIPRTFNVASSNAAPTSTTALSSVNTGDGSTLAQTNDKQNDKTKEDDTKNNNWWWVLIIIAIAGGILYAIARRRQSQES